MCINKISTKTSKRFTVRSSKKIRYGQNLENTYLNIGCSVLVSLSLSTCLLALSFNSLMKNSLKKS